MAVGKSPTYLLFSTPRWRPPVAAIVIRPHGVTNKKECEVAHSELLTVSQQRRNRQLTWSLPRKAYNLQQQTKQEWEKEGGEGGEVKAP